MNHNFFAADADRARKHGMEEYIAADPITMDHHDLFQELQRLSLDWRLQDPFASLVNISAFFKLIKFRGLLKNKLYHYQS